METRYGVMVEQYALDIADGGAGRLRGGRGLVRDYRITADEATFTGTFGRHKYLPWGMAGGSEGSRNYSQFFFADGRPPEVRGKTAQCRLKKGDVVRLVTGTGGGYGNPLERPTAKVRDDVRNGYLTLKQAEEQYGIVLDPGTIEVVKILKRRKHG